MLFRSSRKFPCKHALALLMLWADGALESSAEAAGFAQEWAEERAGRQTRLAQRADRQETPAADPAAAERRQEQRLALMDAGMDDFTRWLTDLGRQGLAGARQQPYAWWDSTAARLVDAQLPGLADQIRAMGSDVHRRDDWADHLLAAGGRWWTVARAWEGRERLTAGELADLRVALGWAIPTAEVRQADEVEGIWLVLGAHRTADGRLQQQRTWLWNEATSEVVQVLDFAVDPGSLATPQLAGTVLAASLARYPGSSPRRALFRGDPVPSEVRVTPPPSLEVTAALGVASSRLTECPWADRVPVLLGPVRLTVSDAPGVTDPVGHWLPLVPDAPVWRLLALTRGEPMTMFGELEDGELRPLSVVLASGLVAL